MNSVAPIDHPLLGLSSRIPPSNLQAEQALLGALLANNKAYARIPDHFRAEHFIDPFHQRVYAAIQAKIEAGGVADVVTLRPQFENDLIEQTTADENGVSTTREILAPYYLARLLLVVVGIINAGEYAEVIYDCWLRREISEAGEAMRNQAFRIEGDEVQRSGRMLATDVATSLLALADPGQETSAISLRDATIEVMHNLEQAMLGNKPKTIPSGLPKLDRMTGGLRQPQLVMIGARPSMGKSVFGGVLALAAARHVPEGEAEPGTVLFFSQEMAPDELAERFLANISGVNGTFLRDGQLNQQELDTVVGARSELLSLPIIIDGRPAITLSQIRVRARAIAARKKLAMVVVDYLGLMGAPAELQRHGPTQVVEHNTQGLKRLAKELKVPFVVLVQLNRGVEGREDKRPGLADLRQSGSIEQDADIVAFLYRDEYYIERSEPQMKPDESQADFDARHASWKALLARVKGRLELIIAKQRRGPTGTVHLRFDGATSRIWQEGDGDE